MCGDMWGEVEGDAAKTGDEWGEADEPKKQTIIKKRGGENWKKERRKEEGNVNRKGAETK